jgi:hypothetical protein
MVQKRRSLIENNDINVIALQQRNQFRRQLRRVAERRIHKAVEIDVNRHVDVAVRLRASAGSGAEKVGLEDLLPGTKAPIQDLYESLMIHGHVCIICP